MKDLKEIIESFEDKLKDNNMSGANGVYQFTVTDGEESREFHIIFESGSGMILEGLHDSPDISLKIGLKHFEELIAGKLNPTMAFMTGKLKINGDMSLALKLQNLLS